MEEDKKKKKNKKKKNKQNKPTTEDAPLNGETASSVDQKCASNGHDNSSQVSGTADVQNNNPVQNIDVDRDIHTPVNTEESILAKSEKQQFRQREAMLEETVIKLQNDKYALIQKEAMLEETIKKSQNEKYVFIQKEAMLEETIKQSQNEKYVLVQTEADLEMKLVQLQMEKDSWLQKENSSKEIISSLNDDITRLQAQVAELEESMNILLKERQQLVETLSTVQTQLQNTPPPSDEVSKLASENEDLNFQMEAAGTLIDKLITENAELVEKVNELCIELDRQSATSGLSSTIESYPTVGTTDPISESKVILLDQKESVEVPLTNKRIESDYVDVNNATEISKFSGAEESEIVQIPLSDNEIQVEELQAVESDISTDVSLSDAPLTGAPFRLISFVAKYVSGADLVNDNSV